MMERPSLREPGVTNRRRWLTLQKKLEIIEAHESGKSYATIARENEMNESSIRSIVRRKFEYRELSTTTAPFISRAVTRQRNPLLCAMEETLVAWIEESNQKSAQLSEQEIQQKAREIFNELKEKDGGKSKETFAGSRGWFYRFKNRVNFRTPAISLDKGVLDKNAAENFIHKFREIVREGGYTSQQIFNVGDTVLYWKKLPNKTENEQSLEGYKTSRESLTVLLGGNASGDLKFIPLVVFRSETPSALRFCEKNTLPVIWRSNRRAWLTKEIFEDWFSNYFCPTVSKYCKESGIAFKVLLLLDSSPSYAAVSANNVQVVFQPPNTARILQPINQWIFSQFKGCYLRQILSQAMEAAAAKKAVGLPAFCKNYNVKNAVENIAASWNEISASDLISVWHKLLPDVMPKNLEAQVMAIAEDIVTMGQNIGFETLETPDVQECIDSESEPDCDLVDVDQGILCKEEPTDDYEVEFRDVQNKEMDVDDLERILQGVDSTCETILASDSDTERSIKVRQVLLNGIQCYRELYVAKNKNQHNNDVN